MSSVPVPVPVPVPVHGAVPVPVPVHGAVPTPAAPVPARTLARRLGAYLTFAAALFASTLTFAQEPAAEGPADAPVSASREVERHLEDGRRLYRELDFPGSVDAMRRALNVPGVSAAQRLEAWEYLGAAYVVLDREAEAEAAFREVFALDPYHRVREPSGSPKIERFVEALRRQVVSDAALDPEVELRALLPAAARVDRPVPLRVEVEGPPSVASVEARVRPDDEREWRSVPLERVEEGAFEGELPAPANRGNLEVYAEARDARGRVVSRAGEPLVPLVLPVRERDDVPLRRRPWVWVAVGVVVVAATVGIAVAAAGRETAPNGTLPPGQVTLPLR
ncbi:MAG: hypothetical protein H6724_05735 [Sandaracinus sp.]|nr:hypothetical protein [Sandaracinus sp.]MCB9618938.1 hypothetical protein [Sandaracinus sp.]